MRLWSSNINAAEPSTQLSPPPPFPFLFVSPPFLLLFPSPQLLFPPFPLLLFIIDRHVEREGEKGLEDEEDALEWIVVSRAARRKEALDSPMSCP